MNEAPTHIGAAPPARSETYKDLTVANVQKSPDVLAHEVASLAMASGHPPDKTMGALMVAIVIIASRSVPVAKLGRGKIINALSTDFRQKLQMLLPF